MLYLSEKDITRTINLNQVMDAIEEAYDLDLKGAYQMPPRMHVNKEDNTLLYMPCFKKSIFGTKILSLFPGNAAQNKPVIQGLFLLNCPESGTPLALLDGASLTAIRTGAVGGVAIRHLSRKKAKTVGLVGAGVQGFHQVLYACKARNIEEVNLFDLSGAKSAALAGKLERMLPGVNIEESAAVEKLLKASEIVITATPATRPVLPDDQDLLKGRLYIGIGSYKPEMREFPAALYSLVDKVYIDTEHGLEESGDLIAPLENNWIRHDQIIKLGKIVGNKEVVTGEGTILFKSVGMALFDLVVSELIYNKALENSIGTVLEL